MRPRAWRMLIVALVLVIYFPVVAFDFSGWDDLAVLAHNPKLLSPTVQSLGLYWSQPEFHLYIPLTQTAWWVIAHGAGWPGDEPALRPWAFHAANLLVHALACVGAFELLRRLRFPDAAAALGASAFAAHPVQVEPVAWAAGLKDVLAGALSIAALACYVDSVRDRRAPSARAYAAACVLTLAATLSKPSAVVVPMLAAILDLLILRRSWRDAWPGLAGLLLLVIPCVLWTRAIQPSWQGEYVGFAQRGLVAADALAFYAGKLLWPINLAFDYGRTPQAVLASPGRHLTAAGVVAIGVACVLLRRYWPWGFTAAMIFVAGVLPVLGLVPFDFQTFSTVGDHYLYLSMLGPAVLVAGSGIHRTRTGRAVSLGVLIVLAVLAHRQVWVWRSAESLARHAISVNPRSWASHNNLADHLLRQGRADEALQPAETALALRPESPAARRTLVMVLTHLAADRAEAGRLDEALGLYHRAVEVAPEDPDARRGVEMIRATLDRTDEPATKPR